MDMDFCDLCFLFDKTVDEELIKSEANSKNEEKCTYAPRQHIACY